MQQPVSVAKGSPKVGPVQSPPPSRVRCSNCGTIQFARREGRQLARRGQVARFDGEACERCGNTELHDV